MVLDYRSQLCVTKSRQELYQITNVGHFCESVVNALPTSMTMWSARGSLRKQDEWYSVSLQVRRYMH